MKMTSGGATEWKSVIEIVILKSNTYPFIREFY